MRPTYLLALLLLAVAISLCTAAGEQEDTGFESEEENNQAENVVAVEDEQRRYPPMVAKKPRGKTLSKRTQKVAVEEEEDNNNEDINVVEEEEAEDSDDTPTLSPTKRKQIINRHLKKGKKPADKRNKTKKAAPVVIRKREPEVEQEEEEEAAAGGAHEEATSAEQRRLEREAKLLLAREKGRIKTEEQKQRDRVRLADKIVGQAHKGRQDTVVKAKKKASEAEIAFHNAEKLIEHAELAAIAGKKAHIAALQMENFRDKKHQEIAHKLHEKEKIFAMEQADDVKFAKAEIAHAQAAHDVAVIAEKQAHLFEEREKNAEMARSKAHQEMQRSRLEAMALSHLRGEDLLEDSFKQTELIKKLTAEREAMDERHKKQRDSMYGVPIPAAAPVADANRDVLSRNRDTVEEYILADVDKEIDRPIECPKYQGLACGGPARGKCDRVTGTCTCNTGVGATGGYFGAACECGWAKNKCNPPECHWCASMSVCVKDREECKKRPRGREGPDADDDYRQQQPLHSESIRNEHHDIVSVHSGLHDHSKSIRENQNQDQKQVHSIKAEKKNQMLDEDGEPGEALGVDTVQPDNSTSIIVILCLLLFAAVMMLAAYLGLAPKGKSREDSPTSVLDSVASERTSARRRQQANRD